MRIDSVRALLLNSSFEPLTVVSWQKALVLWFQDKVEIVEYHSVYARSAKMMYKLPSVLKLKSYVSRKHIYNVRFCRENIYMRDNHTCQYCGKKCSHRELTLDHVIPASKSGPKNWTNMVSACRPCNQKKGNKTPKAAGMRLRSEPRAPSWLPSPDLNPQLNSFPHSWLQYLNLKMG